jgi:Protein of unknown function (DUF3592)
MPRVTLPSDPRTEWVPFVIVGSLVVAFLWWDSLGPLARGMLLAADGVAVLLGVLRPALRVRERVSSGAPAQGTVVGAEQKSSGQSMDRPTVFYHPKVRFTTPDGRTVVFTSGLGSDNEPEMGYPVRVRYRPDNPELAEIETRWVWMVPAALGLLGGLGLLVAGVVVYFLG